MNLTRKQKHIMLMVVGFAAIIVPGVIKALDGFPWAKGVIQVLGGVANLIAFTRPSIEAIPEKDEGKTP